MDTFDRHHTAALEAWALSDFPADQASVGLYEENRVLGFVQRRDEIIEFRLKRVSLTHLRDLDLCAPVDHRLDR